MLRGSRARTLVSVSLSGVLVGTLAAGLLALRVAAGARRHRAGPRLGPGQGRPRGVTFKGTTPAKATAFVKAAYKDLGTLRPQVPLSEMSHTEGSDRATATLVSRWDVSTSPTDWTYETQVPMTPRRRPVAGVVDARRRGAAAHRRRDPRRRPQVAPARRHRRRRRRQDHDRARGRGRRHRQDEGVRAPRPPPRRSSSAALIGIDPARYRREGRGGRAPRPSSRASRCARPTRSSSENGAAIDARSRARSRCRPCRCSARAARGPRRSSARSARRPPSRSRPRRARSRPATPSARPGCEYRYDAQLRGTPGLAVHAVKRGADGSVLDKRELFAEVSTEGEPLKITLDPKAQTAAEAALAKQTTHPTALVAVRVSTGEMLAAAVGPGANGSTLALAGKEAPGSTFKIVSSLALVRKGATADTKLPCTETLTVNGRRFSNYTTYPEGQARRHPDADRPRLLVQHGLHQPAREGEPGRPRPPRRSRSAWARSSTCPSPASSARCRRPTTSSSTRRRSSARAASRPRR